MQVQVRDNNVEQALRALKKKLQREGVFREMKLKQHFEKPSVKKAREKAEAVRRSRKLARKNIDKGTKKKSPFKSEQGVVLGRANNDGTIEVASGLSPKKKAEVIRHEKLHQKEIKSGKLNYDDGFVYYGKKKFERKNGQIAHAGKWKQEGDHSLPWEKFAHKHD